MAAYYTRAKARTEVEPEDLEQGDSASVTTTTIASIIPVGLQVESMGGFESMATEMAGPVATHPQLPPEGGHPSVGGHGVSGSANSPLVGSPPWDTPVDQQTHLIVRWLVLPMLRAVPIWLRQLPLQLPNR